MSNRPIIAPKGGLLEGGVSGWSQTQATSSLNLNDTPDFLANDLYFPEPFDINESFDNLNFDLGSPGSERYVCSNNSNVVESPPETLDARRKRFNTVKRNYQEIQQQEKNNYQDDLGQEEVYVVRSFNTSAKNLPSESLRTKLELLLVP